ncbi:MAG: zinc-ribbon domain-containing protein, partial [Firmicutes bacterium]|nr:zinc-ribbon domain-containing protein [Bacillota bacterium]
MTSCPKCNKQLAKEAKFCGSCGTEIKKAAVCRNCGEEIDAESVFCQNCGTAVLTESEPTKPEKAKSPVKLESPVKSESPAIPEKKSPAKWLLWGGIALVALSVVAFVLILIMGDGTGVLFSFGEKAKSTSNYALYIKDDEIFYTEVPGIEPRQITTNFFSDNLSEYLYNDYILGNYCTISRDGKKLFFPDKNDGLPDYGLPLYFCYLDKPDQDT